MKTILTGARVIDPAQGIDGARDVLIEGGRISALDKPGAFSSSSFVADAVVEQLAGKIITPGLIDIHTHLREPGYEYKETVASGALAAVAGGFTAICCMPNTKPVNDNGTVTDYIIRKSREVNGARVYPIGAITKGSEGKELSLMVEMYAAGAVAFSDDGLPVMNAQIMRRALEYAQIVGAVLTCHEEDLHLSRDFSMNESLLSLKMGLGGMPGTAEEVMIGRDIELSLLTGCRVHFCHVTTARGVLMIKRAKEDGIEVTGEVTPHHFALNEHAVEGFNTQAKMSPPLRSEKDRVAVLEALQAGVLDCIASDHAPHEADTKSREFANASKGIIGLQSTLSLTLEQVRRGKLTLGRAIEALTIAPAKTLKLNGGTLCKGALADIAIIDLEKKYLYTEECIRSKSKNTPFLGQEFQGACVQTYVGGEKVYDALTEVGA